MSQQCAAAARGANVVLGCINQSIVLRSWEGTAVLYASLVRPHLDYSGQFTRHTEELETEKSNKDGLKLETKSYKKLLKELDTFSSSLVKRFIPKHMQSAKKIQNN